jgi:hypothetical protein
LLCPRRPPARIILYLISGVGYGLYFDLNPLEPALVALAILGVFRRVVAAFSMKGAWRAWNRLAYHRKTAVAAGFAFALLIRAALLSVILRAEPATTDEFSHLLIVDPLAHGRLTNPTHPRWVHFESIHNTDHAIYNSDYFPGGVGAGKTVGASLDCSLGIDGDVWALC